MPSKNLKQIYYLKIRLLINGLRIDKQFYETMKKRGIDFYRGRKGGAGPAGGRYFIF